MKLSKTNKHLYKVDSEKIKLVMVSQRSVDLGHSRSKCMKVCDAVLQSITKIREERKKQTKKLKRSSKYQTYFGERHSSQTTQKRAVD